MENGNASSKATIREFVEMVRGEGLSHSMLEIQTAIAIERLREEHGIEVDADKFARMVAR